MTARPIYHTSPPAKLNVFLELLGRRDDGFHELDTVMIGVDWRDELQLRLTDAPGITLHVDWADGRAEIARQLHVDVDHPLLDVPADRRNLVYRALSLVSETTGYDGGWEVRLRKRIPSGAGMGGASSDAAAALRLARAALGDAYPQRAAMLDHATLADLAASLGSDVPFFLGEFAGSETAAEISPDAALTRPASNASIARALGRGERLTFYPMPQTHHFVVVYPGVALSTAAVYSRAVVTVDPKCGLDAVNAFIRPNPNITPEILYNALAGPASGLSPRIAEALECLDHLTAEKFCQMTGSGSACFAWTSAKDRSGSAIANEASVATIRDSMSGGALVQAVASCPAAPEIHIV